MNLYFGYIQSFQSVMQSVSVVGPGAGVYDEAFRSRCFSNETDHLTLEVCLPELQIQPRKFVPQKSLYVVETHGSVDFGTAGAEGSQVHAVEDEDLTQRSPRSLRGLRPRSQGRSRRACRCLRGARTCAERVRQ